MTFLTDLLIVSPDLPVFLPLSSFQPETLSLPGDVLFIEDVARMLRTSRSTVERRRRAGTFPITQSGT